MKEKTVYRFRLVSHIILVGLSMGLSINLFVQFSNVWYIMVLFGLLGLALEMIKLYSLILAKSEFAEKTRSHIMAGILRLSLYIALAGISAVASLGFTLLSLEQQSFAVQTDVDNIQRQNIRSELEEIDDQIDTNMNRYEELPADWVTVSEQYMNRVESLREQREELTDRLREFESQESSGATQDMFVLLGEMVDLDGQSMMFNMMLFLVVILEISIALTTGTMKKDVKLNPTPQEKSRLLEYIDALTEGVVEGKRLNSDSVIAEKTGMSFEEAKTYKNKLLNMTYKGKSLLESGKGATKSNFSNANLKKIASVYYDLNSKGDNK